MIQCFKIKIKNFFILGVFLFVLFGFAHAASAATYYASPTGSGTTCSQASPCTAAGGIAKLVAGDTLYLLDGTYTGDSGMIFVNNVDGRADARITIAAVNDGNVLIDGQNVRQTVWLFNSEYWTLQGFNVANSNDMPVYFSHSPAYANAYNELKRVVAWNTASSPYEGAQIGISNEGYDLVEDCATFGKGRYAGAYSISGQYNTFRRCWGRYNGQVTTSQPKNVFVSYTSLSTVFENNIAEWNRISGNQEQENGMFRVAINDGRQYSTNYYGNTAIIRSTDSNGLGQIFFGSNMIDSTVKNNVVYIQSFASGKKCFDMDGYTATNTADHNTCIKGVGGANSVWDSEWTVTNSLEQETIGSYNLYTNTGPGATIRYRYQNGVLTSTPLWPWPMKDRIKAALNASSYASSPGGSKYVNYDIDATIQDIFGTYPSGSTPTPTPTPAPAPVPTTSTVITNKSSYTAGETITVTANGGNSNVQEWVAVYIASNPDSSFAFDANSWKYLNGTQTIPSAPVPYPATVTFTAPSTPGTYNIRYFAQVGYQNRLAVSNNITVVASVFTADLNSDGRVNSVDAAILMGAWGQTSRPKADINQDGIVNSVDASLMMGQWSS